MSYKIREILLDPSVFSRYRIRKAEGNLEERPSRLQNLSKINIFVGPNNSGKSRFIRHLFSSQVNFIPADFNLTALDGLIADCNLALTKMFAERNLITYGGLGPGSKNFSPVGPIAANAEFLRPFITGIEQLANVREGDRYEHRGANSIDRAFIGQLNQLGRETQEKLRLITSASANSSYHFYSIYIPTLRGLRPVNGPDNY